MRSGDDKSRLAAEVLAFAHRIGETLR
jgi:hypothetical protein